MSDALPSSSNVVRFDANRSPRRRWTHEPVEMVRSEIKGILQRTEGTPASVEQAHSVQPPSEGEARETPERSNEEIRADASRALDALATVNPIAYDVLRHVASRWVHSYDAGDDAMEDAMRLSGWAKWRLEWTTYRALHPELELSQDVDPERARFLARSLETDTVRFEDRRTDIASAPTPPREIIQAPQSTRARLMRFFRRTVPPACETGIRLPLDAALDARLCEKPLLSAERFPLYETLLRERGGLSIVDDAIAEQRDILAPGLHRIRPDVLRQLLLVSIGEWLIQEDTLAQEQHECAVESSSVRTLPMHHVSPANPVAPASSRTAQLSARLDELESEVDALLAEEAAGLNRE